MCVQITVVISLPGLQGLFEAITPGKTSVISLHAVAIRIVRMHLHVFQRIDNTLAFGCIYFGFLSSVVICLASCFGYASL